MLRINDPEFVLICNFKKFVLRGRKGKQLLHVSRPVVNKNVNITNDVNLQYYQHLLNQGHTKSYASVLALLLRQKVNGINLRAKHTRVYFADGSHIKIDLTSPEIVDHYENLLDTIIHNYANERKKSISQAFKKENIDITFTRNNRDNRSFYSIEKNNLVCELMCNERADKFHLGEEKLVEEVINKLVEENDKKINIDKVCTVPKCSPFTDTSMYIPMSIAEDEDYFPYDLIAFNDGNRKIMLDNLPLHIVNKALKIVEEHNDKFENKNEKNKEYKKETKKSGRN